MDKNTQQPVAWLSIDCIGERYLCFSEPSDNDERLALYTSPPMPRDVLIDAMRDAVSDLKAGVFLADCGTDIAFRAVDYAAIADRYASQVQTEPVNQQTLAALKRLLECYKMADHHDGYCCCGSPMATHDDPMNCGHYATDAGEYNAGLVIKDMEAAIAAAEAAQPVGQQAETGRADANEQYAARYRWLRDKMLGVDFDWNESGLTVLCFEMPDGCAYGGNCDQNIDNAMQK